ncbi:MAG: hypothetical protein PHG94_09255 [Syntrophomonas sp.]|nr:hypothetical protein [Syntrophomonas sp.]
MNIQSAGEGESGPVEDRPYNALQSPLRLLRLIRNDTGVVPYIA